MEQVIKHEVKWKDFYLMDGDGWLTDSLHKIHAFVETPARGDEPEGNRMLCNSRFSIWDEGCRPKPFSELEESHHQGNVRCKACERIVYGRPPKVIEPGTVKFSGYRKPYKIDDILFLKAKGNYTNVYFVGSKVPKLISMTLKATAENCGFLRVHRSVAVNVNHIKRKFLAKYDSHVIMKDGTRLRVSRRASVEMQNT